MSLPEPPPSLPPAAAALKDRWVRGAAPDAAAALAEHPELLADKSVVLDLAYEEFCLRAEAGAAPDPEEFCDRFPAYRSSLRRLLATHQLLAEHSVALGSAPPPRWPAPGERWGDFTLVRELGRGAFARVYLATEASTGDRPVALKLSFAGGAEARTLGRLNHPGVVPVLSARTDRETGLTAVCMPYLGAATLTDVVDRAYADPGAGRPRRAAVFLEAARAAARPGDPPLAAPPPDPRLARGGYEEGVALLGLGLAEALAFLHGRGVYHLDLKPSNVLLDAAGRPMLLDFNLSADGRNAGPRPGGTLPYMAPEQVEALTAEPTAVPAADGRADLFSLGAILYELLTGVPPFGATAPGPLRELTRQLLANQCAGCRPVRAAAPRTGRALAALVERCLAFDRDARPASAAEVAAGLRRVLARSRRARLLRRGAVLLVGAAALGAALAAVPRPPGPAERGRLAFQQGKYAEASRLFQQAQDGNPDDARLQWLQALTRMVMSESMQVDEARDQLVLALQTFYAADKGQPRPETQACMAYCLSRLTQHPDAIFWSKKAENGGFKSAALYNNRAYSYLARSDFDAAAADLKVALDYDPNLGATLCNRALLALQRWHRDQRPATAAAGLADARAALETDLQSPDLCFCAAQLTLAARGPGADDEAVRHLRAAVELGHNPATLATDPYLGKALSNHPGFQELLTRRPGRRPDRNFRLVLPVTSLPE